MAETGKKTIHGPILGVLPAYGFAFFLVFHTFFLDLTLADPDGGWHLAAGRLILERGAVPMTDSWSFTAGDTPWYNLSWAFDALLAAIERRVGLEGLRVAVMLSGAAIFAASLRLALRQGAAPLAVAIASLPLALYLPQFLTLRPHLATLALAMACYALLKRPGLAPIYAVSAVALLWSNLHGGVLLVFPILAAFAAEALVKRQGRRAAHLLLSAALCVPALFATPWEWHVFTAMQRTLGSASRAFIDEWASPLATHDVVPLLWLALSLWGASRRDAAWADRLLTLGFAVLAMSSLRHAGVWMLLSLPTVARGIHALLKGKGEGFTRDLASGRAPYAAAVCVMLCVLLALAAPEGWKRRAAAWPEEEIAYLLQSHPGARVFNAYDYGGPLIEKGEGRVKLFIDGRAETAYPASVLEDYRRFHFREPGWETIPERYGAQVVFLPLDAPQLDALRARGWRETYRGPMAVIGVSP